MTASSYLKPGFEPFRGRLNGVSGNGSWCSAVIDLNSYLQIDLGNRYQVSMIAIQGNDLNEFVNVMKKRVNCRYVFTPDIIQFSRPITFSKMIRLGQKLHWVSYRVKKKTP